MLLKTCIPVHVPGEHAKAMEKCSDDEVHKGVTALLAAYPAIPCPDAAVPRMIRSSWGSDPLFRGSYSYVNAVGSPDDIDTLAAPLTVTSSACIIFRHGADLTQSQMVCISVVSFV